jgi:hypothetical protein
MNIKDFMVKPVSGKYSSLDRAYNKLIIETIGDADKLTLERWITYNEVIRELVTICDVDIFDEIKYRLTGNEDVNVVMLDVINRVIEPTLYLKMLKTNIEEYIDSDWVSLWGK